MKLFALVNNDVQTSICAKSSVIDVRLGSECASELQSFSGLCYLFNSFMTEVSPYHIETSPLIWRANQSMDWLLCNSYLRDKRVKYYFNANITRGFVLQENPEKSHLEHLVFKNYGTKMYICHYSVIYDHWMIQLLSDICLQITQILKIFL